MRPEVLEAEGLQQARAPEHQPIDPLREIAVAVGSTLLAHSHRNGPREEAVMECQQTFTEVFAFQWPRRKSKECRCEDPGLERPPARGRNPRNPWWAARPQGRDTGPNNAPATVLGSVASNLLPTKEFQRIQMPGLSFGFRWWYCQGLCEIYGGPAEYFVVAPKLAERRKSCIPHLICVIGGEFQQLLA
jgi:hypothetical protein